MDFDSIVRKEKFVVMVTGYSCGGCITYFAKEHIANTFIYFINDLSIMEMNRVRFQDIGDGIHFFYIIRTPETELLYSEKSPRLITNENNLLTVYEYKDLDRLTKGFTLKGKKVLKKLTIQ